MRSIQETYQSILVFWFVPITAMVVLTLATAITGIIPWHESVIRLMQVLGMAGIMPLLLSFNSFSRIWMLEADDSNREHKLALS